MTFHRCSRGRGVVIQAAKSADSADEILEEYKSRERHRTEHELHTVANRDPKDRKLTAGGSGTLVVSGTRAVVLAI